MPSKCGCLNALSWLFDGKISCLAVNYRIFINQDKIDIKSSLTTELTQRTKGNNDPPKK